MADIFSALATRQSPQQQYFQRLLAEGTNSAPIQHWTQGASRMAHALLAGMEMRNQRDESEAAQKLRMNLPGLEDTAPASPIVGALAGKGDNAMALGPNGQPLLAADGGIMPPQGSDNIYSKAIAANESGGRYDALGPVIPKSGDRAYGKYQVMGANIPAWTRTHYGFEMTPQQFLANEGAQEAVFKGEFGRLAQKYGPQGAARAWFAGEGGMNDPNRKDPLGTTVAQYGQKFDANVAQADPGALPPNARPTQGFAIPGQPQGRPSIDPRMGAYIKALLGSRDPTNQRLGFELWSKYQAQNTGVTTVDLGNEIGIMDKQGNIIRREPKTRDPMDAEGRRLDIETKRKGLDASPTVQRIKQPDGSELAVQWDPQRKEWMPLKAPEGGNPVGSPKLTEQQSKDVGFYNRGQKILPQLEKQDEALTSFMSSAGSKIPLAGNYLKSDAYRQAQQTGRELLAVILRKDTGAAVTDSEMELYGSIYLPSPGDDEKTIKQKRASRATAIEGIRMGLGPADIIFRSREAAEKARSGATDEPAGNKTKTGVQWSVE